MPCIVGMENDLDMFIGRVQGIDSIGRRCHERLQGLERRARDHKLRPHGIDPYRIYGICHRKGTGHESQSRQNKFLHQCIHPIPLQTVL